MMHKANKCKQYIHLRRKASHAASPGVASQQRGRRRRRHLELHCACVPEATTLPGAHSLARPLVPLRSPPPNTSCPPPWPGHSHSFPDCLLIVCQCTRARSPPPHALFPPTLPVLLALRVQHENGKGIFSRARGEGGRGEMPRELREFIPGIGRQLNSLCNF